MGEEEVSNHNVVNPVYVSCSINSTPHCLDWGPNGLVIFGSSHAVHMYDPRIKVRFNKIIIELLLTS